MLGDITAADEIFIVTGRTDMRKSIDGLCAIVELYFLYRSSASATTRAWGAESHTIIAPMESLSLIHI